MVNFCYTPVNQANIITEIVYWHVYKSGILCLKILVYNFYIEDVD